MGWNTAQANGAAILNYTATCVAAAANPGLPTRQITTGPGKRAVVVGGMVAGKSYACSVFATNGNGAGPPFASTPLVVNAKA